MPCGKKGAIGHAVVQFKWCFFFYWEREKIQRPVCRFNGQDYWGRKRGKPAGIKMVFNKTIRVTIFLGKKVITKRRFPNWRPLNDILLNIRIQAEFKLTEQILECVKRALCMSAFRSIYRIIPQGYPEKVHSKYSFNAPKNPGGFLGWRWVSIVMERPM